MTGKKVVMKPHYLKRAVIGILFGICAALLLWIGAYFGQQNGSSQNTSTVNDAAPILNVAGVGGPFTLTDQNGATVTEKNLIGKYTVIFFGFTYCPAICPTELQKITGAYATLPPETKDKLQLYFISVDPARDTQEILKNYVGLFDPKWVGLRGDDAQTEAVKKSFKVYAAKVPQGDSYTMDHSTFIYVMGPDGTLKHMFRNTDNADVIAETLKSLTK